MLSHLPELTYLLRRDNSPTRVVSPPEKTRGGSHKRSVESFKDFSEKLARPWYPGGRVVSDTRDHLHRALKFKYPPQNLGTSPRVRPCTRALFSKLGTGSLGARVLRWFEAWHFIHIFAIVSTCSVRSFSVYCKNLYILHVFFAVLNLITVFTLKWDDHCFTIWNSCFWVKKNYMTQARIIPIILVSSEL